MSSNVSSWVEIPNTTATDQKSPCYYWNPSTGVVSWAAPQDGKVVWKQAGPTSDGRMYFYREDTKETAWEAPGMPAKPVESPMATQQPQQQGTIPVTTRLQGWQFAERKRPTRSPPACGDAAGGCSQDGVAGSDQAGEWVEVKPIESGLPYFWNPVKGITVTSLPAGVRAQWRYCRSQLPGNTEVVHYYIEIDNPSRVVWKLEGMPEEVPSEMTWAEIGTAVTIFGLVTPEGSMYNGQHGTVEGCRGDRVVVNLSENLGNASLLVHPRHLHPLKNLDIVMMNGLITDADLNGQPGTVEKFDFEQKRYSVRMATGGPLKSVKFTKVIPMPRLWDLAVEGCCEWLQWRGENKHLYVDSRGQHQRFFVHLPIGFAAWLKESSVLKPAAPWPVMVYLHGSGGTSFFQHSKKTLKTPGMQYAASKFVIVSPVCNWNWREPPKDWVHELISDLRTVSWIDHRRIYLTGCSMGGMGAWEVGAQRPELFAAVAPIAGHHQAERTQHIAKALRKTPIFVVHSRSDETCPLRLEEVLWEELEKEGNDQVTIHEGHIDHCSMFERVYCDEHLLYDWLLQQRQHV
eukprot:gnl/TRDRNA2_/TRDRNA2_188315_c0_seq1.p1 gnl/TRDRNA2_/TRDRNA2_188315_c0~~gnl/TRDRNA2_/TRDRNA2_188315_c0_seq1.p1  ORF type:complete len:587 (-),score=91.02 gnl/TRDRNA2_/TRDRNA2_188315_c0_seq1:32-1750(-)